MRTNNPIVTTDAPARAAGTTTTPPWWQRTMPSVVVLTLVLFIVAQLPDPGGYLSTDVGGKTATIEVIVDEGPRNPDLGYWAEQWDEDGSLYPMWSTAQVGDSWVNATTLPMLYLVAPLWKLGGARLAILIPVLGTVLAAAGAAALARRLGGNRLSVALSFWLVGLASPATIYALDFWEHSLGLGLIVWGVVAGLDASQNRRLSPLIPLACGLAFGAAASMRQEALVYGFVAGAVLVGRLVLARRPLTAMLRGATVVLGLAGGLAMNALLEWWVFGVSLRTGRGSGTAVAAGTDLGVRVKEAVVTAASPSPSMDSLSLVIAGLLVVLLVILALRSDRPMEEQRVIWFGLGAIGLMVVLDLLIDGMRFVPGMVATTPLVAFGVVRGWGRGNRRAVALVAAGALPLVWMTQFAGGATAQWGGRYTLSSGVLFLVVAVVSFESDEPTRARSTMRAIAVAGAVITVVGIGWTVMRTHGVADAGRALADRPEPALVFKDPFLAREPGPLGLGEQWLTAYTDDMRAEASAVLLAADIESFGYVDYALDREAPPMSGYHVTGDSTIDLVNDLQLRVTTFAVDQ